MCYSALVKRDLDLLQKRYGAIVIRDQIDAFQRAVAADPQRFPPPSPDDRIYPGHYAPILHRRDDRLVVEMMRYGAHPPPTVSDPKRYTTFNARRDNLHSSFWSTAFMRHHGFAVLEAFFEWVAVADLLKAGVVGLEQVKAEFHKQAEERKAKILAAGKPYKPTATELKDPRFRQIVIEFKPQDGHDLLVPVIFSYARLEDGRWDAGFAIVTDEPPPEISEAGHDRCPVVLAEAGVEAWLRPEGKSARDLDAVLTQQSRVHFTHKLAEAA